MKFISLEVNVVTQLIDREDIASNKKNIKGFKLIISYHGGM
jgi:hypothetical protein